MTNTQEESRNIPQRLMVGLIYPAVLGVFVFEVMSPLTQKETLSDIEELFKNNFLLVFSKILLVLGTLIFYCCDFLGAEFFKIRLDHFRV